MKLLKQQLETAEAKTTRMHLRTAPHRNYPPTLKHDGLEWVAIATFSDGSQLVGRGNCPSLALVDYDLQWLGIKGTNEE